MIWRGGGVGSVGGGGTGGGMCVVWGRVCPDWEACSLYLLEVGIREWEKLGLKPNVRTIPHL